MVKLQRLKKIFKTITNGAKKVIGKVIKPVVKFAIKKSPALLQNLVTLLEKGDPLKIRQILLNALPAGGYVNQVIDIVIALSKSGVYKEAMGLLEQLIDGKLTAKSFIDAAKKILSGSTQVKKIYDEEKKISDQAKQLRDQQKTGNKNRILKKAPPKQIIEEEEEEDLEYEEPRATAEDIFGAPVNK